jgi:hypothetical protein
MNVFDQWEETSGFSPGASPERPLRSQSYSALEAKVGARGCLH